MEEDKTAVLSSSEESDEEANKKAESSEVVISLLDDTDGCALPAKKKAIRAEPSSLHQCMDELYGRRVRRPMNISSESEELDDDDDEPTSEEEQDSDEYNPEEECGSEEDSSDDNNQWDDYDYDNAGGHGDDGGDYCGENDDDKSRYSDASGEYDDGYKRDQRRLERRKVVRTRWKASMENPAAVKRQKQRLGWEGTQTSTGNTSSVLSGVALASNP